MARNGLQPFYQIFTMEKNVCCSAGDFQCKILPWPSKAQEFQEHREQVEKYSKQLSQDWESAPQRLNGSLLPGLMQNFEKKQKCHASQLRCMGWMALSSTTLPAVTLPVFIEPAEGKWNSNKTRCILLCLEKEGSKTFTLSLCFRPSGKVLLFDDLGQMFQKMCHLPNSKQDQNTAIESDEIKKRCLWKVCICKSLDFYLTLEEIIQDQGFVQPNGLNLNLWSRRLARISTLQSLKICNSYLKNVPISDSLCPFVKPSDFLADNRLINQVIKETDALWDGQVAVLNQNEMPIFGVGGPKADLMAWSNNIEPFFKPTLVEVDQEQTQEAMVVLKSNKSQICIRTDIATLILFKPQMLSRFIHR